MNGVHDMGGLGCFGPIEPDPEEPLFHAEWERRVLGLTLAMGASGTWNLDQSRSARESLPPALYLSAGYYRIWFEALTHLLVEHGLISKSELDRGGLVEARSSDVPSAGSKRILRPDEVAEVLAAGAPVERKAGSKPAFEVGQHVRVRNRHSPHHTRLPAYIRGHVGAVTRVHGYHVFPDAHARAQGECPEWLYSIGFEAAELWGEDRGGTGRVQVDCWEPYLEPCADRGSDPANESGLQPG